MSFADLFVRIGNAIFGGTTVDPADAIDPALLDQLIDAIVDAVDPRLRLMPRYRRRLAPAARRSIRHLRALAPLLPAPIELSRAAWSANPAINAFFATGADVQTLVDRSPASQDFFGAAQNAAYDAAFCVLAMRRDERVVLAPALIDGEVRRDVAQTTVGFGQHRLFGAAGEPSTMRASFGKALLTRIAGLALERIVALRDRATELETRKSMMATRLRMLNLRRGNLQEFAADEPDPSLEIAALERNLEIVVEDHLEAKTELATLDHGFEQIEAVLGEPEKHFGVNSIAMRVSHTGYKLDAGSQEPASDLHLNELWIGSNLRAVIVPVRVARSALSN